MSEVAYDPPDTNVEKDDDDDIEIEIAPYPDWADLDEQRRAHVAQFLGYAAGEMSKELFAEYLLYVAYVLEHGKPPPKRKLEAVK